MPKLPQPTASTGVGIRAPRLGTEPAAHQSPLRVPGTAFQQRPPLARSALEEGFPRTEPHWMPPRGGEGGTQLSTHLSQSHPRPAGSRGSDTPPDRLRTHIRKTSRQNMRRHGNGPRAPRLSSLVAGSWGPAQDKAGPRPRHGPSTPVRLGRLPPARCDDSRKRGVRGWEAAPGTGRGWGWGERSEEDGAFRLSGAHPQRFPLFHQKVSERHGEGPPRLPWGRGGWEPALLKALLCRWS